MRVSFWPLLLRTHDPNSRPLAPLAVVAGTCTPGCKSSKCVNSRFPSIYYYLLRVRLS